MFRCLPHVIRVGIYSSRKHNFSRKLKTILQCSRLSKLLPKSVCELGENYILSHIFSNWMNSNQTVINLVETILIPGQWTMGYTMHIIFWSVMFVTKPIICPFFTFFFFLFCCTCCIESHELHESCWIAWAGWVVLRSLNCDPALDFLWWIGMIKYFHIATT